MPSRDSTRRRRWSTTATAASCSSCCADSWGAAEVRQPMSSFDKPRRRGLSHYADRLPVCLLLIALGVGQARASAGKELTNELIHGGALDGRPASGFVWSPAGDRFVFMQRSGSGADDPSLLNLYDTATRKVVPLTSSEEGARKLTASAPQWSPDGNSLLVVSGGDLYLLEAPRTGPLPNPRKLTSTEGEEKDPKFSPDGTRIGFVRDHDLYVIDLKGSGAGAGTSAGPEAGTARALTSGGTEEMTRGEVDWVYDEEFELSSAWWWSPAGDKVAFLEFDERAVPVYPIVDWSSTHPETTRQRYPKAGDPTPVLRLGIVPVEARGTAQPASPEWIDLGPEKDIYIPRVAWTPRGSLAVIRMDRTQARLDLLLCPTGGARCKVLFEEKDPSWLNIDDDARYFD